MELLNIDELVENLVAMGLAIVRPTAMLAMLAPFSRLEMAGLLRGGIAFALALPNVGAVGATLETVEISPVGLVLVSLKEGLLGVCLGLVWSIPFWASGIAGDLLDQQRGGIAEPPEPGPGNESSALGTLFMLSVTTVFLLAGGFSAMAASLFESYRFWPLEQALPVFSADAGLFVLTLLDRLTGVAVLLAAPGLVVMLLAEFALALVARSAPNLHLFDIGMSVKSLALFAVLPLYAAMAPAHLSGLFQSGPEVSALVRALLP